MAISRRSSKRSARSGGGGIGRVAKAEEQSKRRRAAGDIKWLKLDDGDEVIVRGFPPDEFFKDGFTHRTPIEVKGKTYYVDKMCLDQDDDGTPCPGCKDELQRRYKFWWPVIARDYAENDDDKAADTVVVWSGGITVAKMLNKLARKRDLSKRDLVVSRSGSTKDDTEYDIDWEDDEDVPYSTKDKKLLEKAPDLKRYTQIPEFDDFYKGFGDDDDEDSNEEVGKRARNQNPFGKKKKSSDDDDGEEQKTTRRRSASRRSSRNASSKKSVSSRPAVRKRRG